MLSPDLFHLYSELIMRSIGNTTEISDGWHCVNNLQYADDAVLIAENETKVQEMVNIIAPKSSNND